MDINFGFGDEEFNIAEMRRLTEKRERFGEDALSDDELYTLAKFKAVTKIFGRRVTGTGQERADRERGLKLWEQLSEDERERFIDWTPAQFAAMWDFLESQREKGDEPS